MTVPALSLLLLELATLLRLLDRSRLDAADDQADSNGATNDSSYDDKDLDPLRRLFGTFDEVVE